MNNFHINQNELVCKYNGRQKKIWIISDMKNQHDFRKQNSTSQKQSNYE